MKRALPSPTKAESDRMSRLKALGCIVCRMKFKTRPYVYPEIHHINDGGRNISHWHTLPLCVYHHQGVPYSGSTDRDMIAVLGHSRHRHGKPLFETDHGTEKYLWELVQRLLRLERWWPTSKIVPRRVA